MSHIKNPYAKYIAAMRFKAYQLVRELHRGDISYLEYRRVGR